MEQEQAHRRVGGQLHCSSSRVVQYAHARHAPATRPACAELRGHQRATSGQSNTPLTTVSMLPVMRAQSSNFGGKDGRTTNILLQILPRFDFGRMDRLRVRYLSNAVLTTARISFSYADEESP